MQKIVLSFLLFMNSIGAEFKEVAAMIKAYIPENPIILEAGAHHGSDTLAMCQSWPKAIIYAFEPIPALRNQLTNKVRGYSNVSIFHYALNDSNGKATFYVSKGLGDGSSSLLEPKDHLVHFPAVSFPQKIEVETITLDDWAQQNNVDHIDLMWLDLQGSEHAVLNGSIIFKSVKALFVEVNFVELYKGGLVYEDFKKWMESEGFTEVYMKIEHETFGDSLFVRNDFVK